MLQLLVTANIVPSSPILVTLMVGVMHSSKMSVLTGATHSVTSRKMAFFGILYTVYIQGRQQESVIGLYWLKIGFGGALL
jgi:hypothetical protein